MNSRAWASMWRSYISDLNLKYGDFSDMEKRPKSKFIPGGVPMRIPNITAHWLRHTFATMLYMAGVDVLTAKEQLGHADVETTLQIYTHLDSTYKRRSMDKLDAYLSEEDFNPRPSREGRPVFGMDDGVGGAEDGADDGGAVDDAGGVYVGALLDGAAGCV